MTKLYNNTFKSDLIKKQKQTSYQPAPNMINYKTGQPAYAAPTPVPKTSVPKTPTTKTTQDPYSSAPIGSQQRSADLMAQAQAMLNKGQSTTTTNNTSSNLAETPISKFYAPSVDTGSNITPYEDVDEDKIRREVLGRYQSQIDATKASYASLMGETKRLGQGRLGESTAMQARGGLLGSDFGAAQTEGVRGLNLTQEKGVLESEAMAVSNIMAQAMGDAQAEIAAKRAAKQYGYAALQEYNAGEQQRKQANIKKVASAMILQGVDPRTMGSQLKELAKTYKVSEADIINAYLEEESTQKPDTEYKTLGKDSVLYDPVTGEIIMSPGSEAGGAGQQNQYSTTKMDQTLSSAQQLLAMAQEDPQIFGRSAAVPIPSALRSDAFRNYDSALKQLKANIAFNELTQMREASKTGGALGQVSNIELGLLESSLGALDMTQSPEAVQKNLNQIISSINNFKQAVAQYGGGDMSMMGGGEDVFAEEW